MIPGEIQVADGDIELNAGREAITVMVANTGDRPVQVGSHYHFAETNPALDFDRAAARGRVRRGRRWLRSRPRIHPFLLELTRYWTSASSCCFDSDLPNVSGITLFG